MLNKNVFLFDLDGVITSTDAFHFEAWSKMAEKIGINLEPEFEHKLKGISRSDSLKLILDEHGINNFDEEKFNELMKFKNDYYIKLLSDLDESDRFENIEELLRVIKDKGYKSVLVSASKNAPIILEKVGLIKYFENIVNVDNVTKSKPDPEIFIKGMELVGANPQECIVIEDSQSGIDAANSAKIDSIAYAPSDDKLELYTMKVKNHKDIIEIIKGG